MRVLVTGSDGYIGTVLSSALQAAGHEVLGLDARLFAGCGFGPEAAYVPPTTVRDIRDVTLDDLIGVEAVVHLAALSNDPMGDLDPETTYAVNHRASVCLARLAKEAGVQRFLYASTCSVYGAHGGDDLVDESAAMAPVTPYAISKVRVEDDLHALADDDFSPTFMRNATCFGVSPRLRADVVLNNLVASAHLTGTVRVMSDGTPWRPLVHVRDVSAAAVALLAVPRFVVHDQAFNVGRTGENHQVADLAALAAEAVPGSTVEITGETGSDPRSYRVDFTKLERLVPAFTATWTARSGAQELARAYRTHALSEADVERFTRLRWLQRSREAGVLAPDLRAAAASATPGPTAATT